MKFGRNQPRSQPIVRVARLEAISMRLPSNPPLTRPDLAQLTGPPASSQEGEDDNELDVSAHIPVDNLAGALPHWNYRVYVSGNGISLVSSWMQRQLFALSFCLSQTDGRHS